MTEFVVDASALAKELLDEEASGRFRSWHLAHRTAGHRFCAPHVLACEVAEVGRRIGRYGDAVLLVSGFDLHPAHQGLDPFLARLKVADASYVALAESRRGTLVTYDARMAEEAQRHGVATLAP